MSMMFFVQPDCPSRFAHQDDHRIKGLNAETIARILLPPPSWLLTADYAPLRSDAGDSPTSIFFSLNLSIYGQSILASEWTEEWFFMNGRVHPYALAWEVAQHDGLESDMGGTLLYTMPALVVRDQGLGASQLKCCGFIQLSSYLTPGNPDKTPFKGFHPFQVFVIFPIHANPWAILCKKMVERRDTHFQTNVHFTCTGKVAGLLDHRLMAQPPASDRDYVHGLTYGDTSKAANILGRRSFPEYARCILFYSYARNRSAEPSVFSLYVGSRRSGYTDTEAPMS
ncbi:transposase [Purpureocillium lavendulum]|uniref:Transposase n=1 Tax=Purpureocillium lavendulum TaxID=1247861 RepID=A0AB34FBJ3_9HYPO|nr:transposase [Purpureocillium lavendulum]